jgi:hypothetical protein
MPQGPLGRRPPTDFAHVERYPLTEPRRAGVVAPTPVVIGVNWYVEFDRPEKDSKGRWWVARDGRLTTVRGGHCVCLRPAGSSDPDSWWEFYNQGDEGACSSADTEVLTSSGWKLWPDCDRSELLGTVNPSTHELEFQSPIAWQEFEHDGPMHYIDHKSMDFAVTPDHRMLVRPWNESQRTLASEFSFTQAKDIGWYSGSMPAPAGWRGVELDALSIGRRRYSGDDFLALLALVTSDGWAGSTENTRNRVSFCCFRPDRYEMVAALAHRLGIGEQPNRKGVWQFSDPDLAAWLRANAYTGGVYRSPHKRVPPIVQQASSRQIKLFLEFFGDQHVAASERRSFFSSSAELVDDLQILLLKLGRRSGIYERDARDARINDRDVLAANCTRDMTLNEWTGDRLSIERKRQIQVESYRGPVYCATVPNGTLVTRRNRQVLISGNCVGFGISRLTSHLNRKRYDGFELYRAAKKVDEWPGEDYDGTSVRAGLDVLRTQGHWLVTRGHTRAAQLSEGIAANRWVTSIKDCLSVLGTPDGDSVEVLNSWGKSYPQIVHMPASVLERLWCEEGEIGVVTDR